MTGVYRLAKPLERSQHGWERRTELPERGTCSHSLPAHLEVCKQTVTHLHYLNTYVFKDVWGKGWSSSELSLTSWAFNRLGAVLPALQTHFFLSSHLPTEWEHLRLFSRTENEFHSKSFSSVHKAREWKLALKPCWSDSLHASQWGKKLWRVQQPCSILSEFIPSEHLLFSAYSGRADTLTSRSSRLPFW